MRNRLILLDFFTQLYNREQSIANKIEPDLKKQLGRVINMAIAQAARRCSVPRHQLEKKSFFLIDGDLLCRKITSVARLLRTFFSLYLVKMALKSILPFN